MNTFTLLMAAFATLIIIISVKKFSDKMYVYIGISFTVLLLCAVVPQITSVIEFASTITSGNKYVAENAKTIIKAMAIVILTEFVSQSCKDNGENSMAKAVELAGKVGIIIIALPLVNSLAQIILSVMK